MSGQIAAADAPLLVQLAHHLQRPVDEATRQRARLHLLDWLACVAGARQAAVKPFAFDANIASTAALLGNVLEMDDVHRLGRLHPGPVVWCSIVADYEAGLDAWLDAAVRGYEAMIGVGATFDDWHYAHFHPTSTAGLFGAAAAVASLQECDVSETAHALGLAGSVTGGLWQMRHEDTMAKQWHVANAMVSGGSTAVWARRGMTGPLSLLEGPQGLYAATCRAPKPMLFGPGWRIEEVSFKPWAACRHAHPVIDCALELRAAGRLAAPFHVETYADALAFCDKPHPTTDVEAKFSLQHAVAVIADGRNATPADFTPEAITALAPLRRQVTVAEDPAITARYPAHFGARLNGLELVDCRGDPERPVTEADIIAKMHMLANWGGLPPSEADRAADLALHGNDAAAVVAMLDKWLK
ncbi:MmgE/PrpD family protein [Sandaracinobacteroides saxicola]|uniref:MmgE/PrpD family protein n=1 Tax=Sandaracinobacteroides saxicola TaxID=2759707 RepID=A0A7G5IJA5_9SPHN|nr:MmgE/PrpD family protein [Sandaracinobacteroides saxicola]QMW23447.1 MmgE/PrpD family protein [Sandaracinobacteroides saxicola]